MQQQALLKGKLDISSTVVRFPVVPRTSSIPVHRSMDVDLQATITFKLLGNSCTLTNGYSALSSKSLKYMGSRSLICKHSTRTQTAPENSSFRQHRLQQVSALPSNTSCSIEAVVLEDFHAVWLTEPGVFHPLVHSAAVDGCWQTQVMYPGTIFQLYGIARAEAVEAAQHFFN